MEVIPHDDVRVQHPLVTQAGLEQAHLKRPACARRFKDKTAVVAAAVDMVNRTREFQAQLASHAPQAATPRPIPKRCRRYLSVSESLKVTSNSMTPFAGPHS